MSPEKTPKELPNTTGAMMTSFTVNSKKTEPTEPGCHRLRLLKTASPKWEPQHYRHASQIDLELRKTISDLCKGNIPWPLFLYGPTGTGKTCAALCLVDRVRVSFYYRLRNLIRELIAAAKGEIYNAIGIQQTERKLWQNLRDADLVVIDEVAMREQESPFAYETLCEVLDIRSGLPLVLISNHNPLKLKDVYDDRIAARVCSGTVVQLKGKNRRLR